LYAGPSSPPHQSNRQTFLEESFPSTHLVPSSSALKAASENNEVELDREEETHTLLEPRLSVSNTIKKFMLDQTIGGPLNTIGFSLVFAGFQGANFEQAVQIARQDFWGLIIAGLKLWPLVTIVNFTLLKSVQSRQLMSGLASLGWGVYLTLIAANERV
jgi:protein Mpv17